MKVVWILGAGFSRSLGGPLLPDLLSKQSLLRVRTRYQDYSDLLERGRAVEALEALLEKAGWEQPERGARAFADAEALLETLDAATVRGAEAARRHLSRLSHFTFSLELAKDVAATARRLVAAECSAFLGNFPVGGERWAPYRKWAQELDAEDVVITFNYDRVVEEAIRSVKRGIDVACPGGPVEPGGPTLLKLHGSIDWRAGPGGKVVQVDVPDFAVACADSELAIASPGPSKQEAAQRWNDLWDKARRAIGAAHSVVFVGYRFPPSDAEARSFLVDQLEVLASTDVTVHTVLGPDSRSPDSQRLTQILHHALSKGHRKLKVRDAPRPDGGPVVDKTYSLNVHPLYAEDFLGIVSRWDVLHAYRFGQ